MTCNDCCGSNTPAMIAGQALPSNPTSVSPLLIPWQNPGGTGACVPQHTNLAEFLEWFHLTVTPYLCAVLPLKGTNCSMLVGRNGTYEIRSVRDVIADCVGGIGGGALIETPVTVTDTPSVNMTAGATGSGHTGISANVVISPTAGNQLTINADGLFVPAAAAGAETPLTVTDSTTINLTPGATGDGHTGLTAAVIISPTAGNAIVANANGLFAAAETPLTVTDSSSVNLTAGATGNGHTGVTAEVIISPTAGNQLQSTATGLFVPAAAAGAETPLTVTDSTTINLTPGATGDGHTGLTAAVIISPTAGNAIVANANGLFAAAETPLTVTDSSSVNLTAGATGNGHTGVTAEVIISPDAGNQLQLNANGLFVTAAAAGAETPLTVTDSTTINLTPGATGDGHTGLTAAVIISPTAGNAIVANANGLFAPAETALTVTDSNTVNLTAGATGNGHTGVTADVIISPDAGNILVANANGLFVPAPNCAQITALLLDVGCIPIITPPTLQNNLATEVNEVYGVTDAGALRRQVRRPTVSMFSRHDTATAQTINGTAATIETNKLIHRWQAFTPGDTTGDILVADVAAIATNKPNTGLFQAYKVAHSGVYNASVSVTLEFSALAADLVTVGPETYKVANRAWYMVTEFVLVKGGVTSRWSVGREEIPLTAVTNRQSVRVSNSANISPIALAANDYFYIESYIEGENAASDDTPVTLTIPNAPNAMSSFGLIETPMNTF